MITIKKLPILLVACVSFYGTSIAQINPSEKEDNIRLGIKGGLNFSNVYDESGEDFVADGKLGLAFGAFLAIPIGEKLGFQPEMHFSQRGFVARGTLFGSAYEFTRTTTHLDIPLLFALRPTPLLTIFLGPQYSYLMIQKDSFKGIGTNIQVENEFENDNIRRNTLSLIGGADVNLGHFIIGGRVGFDLQENRGDGTSDTPRYKNVWVQGTIGYRFYND